MTTLLRMVAHLPPAFSRFVFGAPDQDYRGPICSEQEDRRGLRFGFAFLAAIPATAALTLTILDWVWA